MARCIMCCFKCCLWCLEKFIKFLNRNAYIMVSPSVQAALCFKAPWPQLRSLTGEFSTGNSHLSTSPRLPSMGRISVSQPKMPSCCSCGTLSGQAVPCDPPRTASFMGMPCSEGPRAFSLSSAASILKWEHFSFCLCHGELYSPAEPLTPNLLRLPMQGGCSGQSHGPAAALREAAGGGRCW